MKLRSQTRHKGLEDNNDPIFDQENVGSHRMTNVEKIMFKSGGS